MAVQTHLDQLIDYKSNIIRALLNSKDVVSLIVDKANPDIYGVDGDTASSHMFDYDYIDDTVLEAGAFVMVDCDMVAAPTGTIKDLEVYVQVVVSKLFMELDHKKFKGVKGNRCDNLSRQIDLLLNGSRDYGIGRLQLASARTANVPAAFTSRLLTYRIPDFARDRSVGIP